MSLFFAFSSALVVLGCVVQGPNERIGDSLVPGTVSFAQHIKPMFDAYCGASCHVRGTGALGGLSTSSYAGLILGGNSGPAVVPGDAANSLLIKRLRGQIMPQMPQGDEPFTSTQVANIFNWIQQGAIDN